jgi:integrase
MNIIKRTNKKGDKITFYYDFGREPGQRPSTGVFIYTNPKNQVEKNHNKQATLILETKKSQLIIEQQAVGSAYIPAHKFKANFIEYFEEYVELNKRKGNRHLASSLKQFKLFVKKDFISPIDITENFCKRFRQFLLDKFTGETPGGYYARFKWVINAAESDGYFQKNPTANVFAKSNPSARLKENLEVDEYLKLLQTPCLNEEVKSAFIFCCYTGLRWADIKKLQLCDIRDSILTTRIIQAKTGFPVTLTLHPIANSVLEKQKMKGHLILNRNKSLFLLPSADGANKTLNQWMKAAGIEKHVTWSCARLSFSILLQDRNVDDATVAYLMGHRTTDQVRKTYKRHRPKNQAETISNLPTPDKIPFFLNLANLNPKAI